jgi:segregation and condensation protein A
MMKKLNPNTISLESFEGSFDVLIHLIQKNEIEAASISLYEIILQFIEKQNSISNFDLDFGAEFISPAASLLLLKSQSLLPQNELLLNSDETVEDPHFDIIHHLLDYCRFKQAAKELIQLENYQSNFYPRGNDFFEPKKPNGIEHVSLEELASIFKSVIQRAKTSQGNIVDEPWKISDKLLYIRELLEQKNNFSFSALFLPSMCKRELIVIFLAILELMKSGEVSIINDPSIQQIIITNNRTS